MMAWRGAVEFGGFPINVKLESRVRATRTPSFRVLASSDKLPPISQPKLDHGGKEVETTVKGVEVAKDQFVALTDEQIAAIKGDKDVTVQPRQFCPVDSIDLTLAVRTYNVVPDDKVPGAEGPVKILWNVLEDQSMAYVSQLKHAGSMDSILVIWATKDRLMAADLPFKGDLFETSDFKFEKDAKARKLGKQFIDSQYAEMVGEFDHDQFASQFLARREKAIEAAMKGEVVEIPSEAPKPDKPDLMSVLENAVKETGAKKARGGAKKASAKKPAKKATRSKAKVKA